MSTETTKGSMKVTAGGRGWGRERVQWRGVSAVVLRPPPQTRSGRPHLRTAARQRRNSQRTVQVHAASPAPRTVGSQPPASCASRKQQQEREAGEPQRPRPPGLLLPTPGLCPRPPSSCSASPQPQRPEALLTDYPPRTVRSPQLTPCHQKPKRVTATCS